VDLPVFIISLHRRFCASSNFQLLNCSEALWLRYSFQYFIFHLLDTLYSLWGAQLRTSHQALSFIWKYTLDPVSSEQRFNIIYVWPLGSNITKERENSIFFDSFFQAPLGSFLIDPHKWLYEDQIQTLPASLYIWYLAIQSNTVFDEHDFLSGQS
jgi:hypothetical protein